MEIVLSSFSFSPETPFSSCQKLTHLSTKCLFPAPFSWMWSRVQHKPTRTHVHTHPQPNTSPHARMHTHTQPNTSSHAHTCAHTSLAHKSQWYFWISETHHSANTVSFLELENGDSVLSWSMCVAWTGDKSRLYSWCITAWAVTARTSRQTTHI